MLRIRKEPQLYRPRTPEAGSPLQLRCNARARDRFGPMSDADASIIDSSWAKRSTALGTTLIERGQNVRIIQ